MARVNQPIKIRPIAYNHQGDPDSSITAGETFSCDKPFLIVASKYVPSCSKVYMEVTITKQISSKSIRHVPIYLGLHKEPSYGMLNNDCMFGSCYYPVGADFDIFEKPRGSTSMTTQPVGKLHARIPIVDTVIGLGVDTFENTVSIFCDGKLFYSFKPTLFNIETNVGRGNRWYMAVYSKLYQSISGTINYGRYKTKYLPEGYCTLYQHYWDHEFLTPIDIGSKLKVSGVPPYDGARYYDIEKCKIKVENKYTEIDPLTNRRSLFLENMVADMDTEVPDSYRMETGRSGTPDMSSVNLPCPCEDTPVYLELTTKEATLNTDPYFVNLNYVGIPIEVGLTVKKNDYVNKSFRVCLYHSKGDTYKSYAMDNGTQSFYDFPTILNPAAPVQPNTVGFIFDRKNNMIKIVTEGTIFAEIPIQGVDFSDFHEDAYIFFKSADQAYKDYQLGYVELGDDPISYEIPEPGVKTVYDYWNDSIRIYLTEFPEFQCRMKVRIPVDYVRYYFDSRLYVPFTKENSNGFEPGLNMMWNTFNVVTEVEPHNNEPTMNVFEFFRRIKMDLLKYKKKDFEIDFQSTIYADTGTFGDWPFIDGYLTLIKGRWHDIDCQLNVTDDPPMKYTWVGYIHAFMNYRTYRYIDDPIIGLVAFDSDTNPGYPQWVVINQLPIWSHIDDTWKSKPIYWFEGNSKDSDYVRDTTVNPKVVLSLKPNPQKDYDTQKATVEIFYNGVSLGTQYYDATPTENRDFIHKSFTIPTTLYNPSTGHNLKLTLTSDTGCAFDAVMGYIQINAYATSEI